MVKLTFSVDEQTATTLKITAARLQKSQSLVVREAIADYAARSGRLTEAERRRLLRILDEMLKQPPTRRQAEVIHEMKDIRRARRQASGRSSLR
jgi:hypothetical protein